MTTHESVVICKQCGAPLSPHDLFCTQCGAKQEEPEKKAPSLEGKWFSRAGDLTSPERRTPSGSPARSCYETMPAGGFVEKSAPRVLPLEEDSEEEPAPVVVPAPKPEPVEAVSSAKRDEAVPPRREPEKPVPVRREPTRITPVPYRPMGTPESPSGSAPAAGAARADAPAKPARSKRAPGKKRFLLPVLLLVLLVAAAAVVLPLLFREKGKSEDQILEDLPSQLTTMQLGMERLTLTPESLTIDRRETQNGVDEVYCIIELSSAEYAITRYEQLTYIETASGWVLDDFAPYAQADIRILEEPSGSYDWAINRIREANPLYEDLENSITGHEVSVDGNRVCYVFDIRKTEGLLEISGQITLNCVLQQQEDRTCFWSGSPDDSGVDTCWEVAGVWSGESYLEKDSLYALKLDMEKLSTREILCAWTYDGPERSFSGRGDTCWLIESSDSLITIGISYGENLSDYLRVTFHTDGTCSASIPGQGNFALHRQ